jgi:hypothetical protein
MEIGEALRLKRKKSNIYIRVFVSRSEEDRPLEMRMARE